MSHHISSFSAWPLSAISFLASSKSFCIMQPRIHAGLVSSATYKRQGSSVVSRSQPRRYIEEALVRQSGSNQELLRRPLACRQLEIIWSTSPLNSEKLAYSSRCRRCVMCSRQVGLSICLWYSVSSAGTCGTRETGKAEAQARRPWRGAAAVAQCDGCGAAR